MEVTRTRSKICMLHIQMSSLALWACGHVINSFKKICAFVPEQGVYYLAVIAVFTYSLFTYVSALCCYILRACVYVCICLIVLIEPLAAK